MGVLDDLFSLVSYLARMLSVCLPVCLSFSFSFCLLKFFLFNVYYLGGSGERENMIKYIIGIKFKIIKLVCIKSLQLKLTLQPQRTGKLGMSVAKKI